MNDTPPFEFEAAYTQLETILEKMNSGQVSLEESLKLYEEAEGLIRCCSSRLTEAEKRIDILIKNREGQVQMTDQGRPQTQPFPLHKTTL
mgnify:CR=1 FL=1